MGTYTSNYNLFMPSIGEQGWGELVNENFITIDTTMSGLTTRVGTLESETDAVEERVGTLESKVSLLETEIGFIYVDVSPYGEVPIGTFTISVDNTNVTLSSTPTMNVYKEYYTPTISVNGLTYSLKRGFKTDNVVYGTISGNISVTTLEGEYKTGRYTLSLYVNDIKVETSGTATTATATRSFNFEDVSINVGDTIKASVVQTQTVTFPIVALTLTLNDISGNLYLS